MGRTVGEKDGEKTDTSVFVGEPTNAPSKAQQSRLSRFCDFEISFSVNAFLMPSCSTIFGLVFPTPPLLPSNILKYLGLVPIPLLHWLVIFVFYPSFNVHYKLRISSCFLPRSVISRVFLFYDGRVLDSQFFSNFSDGFAS